MYKEEYDYLILHFHFVSSLFAFISPSTAWDSSSFPFLAYPSPTVLTIPSNLLPSICLRRLRAPHSFIFSMHGLPSPTLPLCPLPVALFVLESGIPVSVVLQAERTKMTLSDGMPNNRTMVRKKPAEIGSRSLDFDPIVASVKSLNKPRSRFSIQTSSFHHNAHVLSLELVW